MKGRRQTWKVMTSVNGSSTKQSRLHKGKAGFTSLYILMILSSLLFLMLAVIEGASGYALRSHAESACTLAGESVLSEFNKELWERYGIFALSAHNERLTRLATYYISENMDAGGQALLKIERLDCSADTQNYPALDAERFAQQIRHTASHLIAGEVLNGMTNLLPFEHLSDTLLWFDEIKAGMDGEIRRAEEALEPPGSTEPDADGGSASSGENQQDRRKVRTLLKRYRESQSPGEESAQWGKSIEPGLASRVLPSSLLEIPSRMTALSRIAAPKAEDAAEVEYIVRMCSHATNIASHSALDLEVEYILFGSAGDSENATLMRSNLFALRSALNLSHIYGDSVKKSEVAAMAAVVSAFIPMPLAEFLIACIWSGLEAACDVDALFSGQTVPFVKGHGDWRTGLDGSTLHWDSQPADDSAAGKFGKYPDYLRVFLWMQPSTSRRVRLMDVMQLNVASVSGETFRFVDYAYGFDLQAEFEKKIRLPGYALSGLRKGTVKQTYAYR